MTVYEKVELSNLKAQLAQEAVDIYQHYTQDANNSKAFKLGFEKSKTFLVKLISMYVSGLNPQSLAHPDLISFLDDMETRVISYTQKLEEAVNKGNYVARRNTSDVFKKTYIPYLEDLCAKHRTAVFKEWTKIVDDSKANHP